MNKKLFMAVLLALTACLAYGQNSFPATGNVGIGTTNPQNPLHINSGTMPSISQLRLTANGASSLSALSYAPDNTSVGFDVDYSGNWVARHSSVAWLYKGGGRLMIQGSSGNTVGGNAVQNTLFDINLSNGNVGIGTTDPRGYKPAVAGSTIAESVTVKLQSQWPDYVFKPAYTLRSIDQTASYIKSNGHLPDMPSAEEIKEKGVDIGEMLKLQTKKIEELTLYLIDNARRDQQKQNLLLKQQRQILKMKKELTALKNKLTNL